MSVDLVLHEQRMIVNPATGEAVSLTGAPGDLAAALNDIRDFESQLREAKNLLSAALLAEMDRRREWTLYEGGLKITGQSDALKPVYDTQGLMEALDELINEGVITPDAVTRTIEPRVEYKIKHAGITALLKNPAIAARLEPFITLAPPAQRRVSVGGRLRHE